MSNICSNFALGNLSQTLNNKKMKQDSEFNAKVEIEKEIATQDESKKENIVKDVLKKVLSIGNASDQLPSAENAYLRATYNEYTDKKRILSKRLKSIKETIVNRAEANRTWAFVQIEPELSECINDIKESLSKYGYKVWILGKSELEKLQPTIQVNKTTLFLLVIWDLND